MTRRGWIAILCALVAGGVFAAVAVAAPHFKKGGTPTCADEGDLLRCRGTLAGLGNENLVIDLQAHGEASFECENPGGNRAPGQNKIPFTAEGSQTIQGSAIKNGNATFNVAAPEDPPPTPTAEDAGCPNDNWKAVRVSDVAFSDINLTITQGGTLLFTCTRPGPVPSSGSVTLSCS
jgi:hypothetical protein